MQLFLIALLGLCYGSFINVLIYRLPNNLSIIYPGSFCPKCKSKIPFYRNVPVISYIIQMGKCHNCKGSISIQYPIIEMLTALSWIFCYHCQYNGINELLFSIMTISFLIPLAIIDLKYMFFPTTLIFPLIFISILFAFTEFYLFENLTPLLGGVISSSFLIFVYLLVKLWFKYKNVKKQPMGFGDILLIIPLGIWVGTIGILISIFFASLIALIIWLLLNNFTSFKLGDKMPFGPYLIISTILVKFFNIKEIIDVIFQTI